MDIVLSPSQTFAEQLAFAALFAGVIYNVQEARENASNVYIGVKRNGRCINHNAALSESHSFSENDRLEMFHAARTLQLLAEINGVEFSSGHMNAPHLAHVPEHYDNGKKTFDLASHLAMLHEKPQALNNLKKLIYNMMPAYGEQNGRRTVEQFNDRLDTFVNWLYKAQGLNGHQQGYY